MFIVILRYDGSEHVNHGMLVVTVAALAEAQTTQQERWRATPFVLLWSLARWEDDEILTVGSP